MECYNELTIIIIIWQSVHRDGIFQWVHHEHYCMTVTFLGGGLYNSQLTMMMMTVQQSVHDDDCTTVNSPWCWLYNSQFTMMMMIVQQSVHHDVDDCTTVNSPWWWWRYNSQFTIMMMIVQQSIHHDVDYSKTRYKKLFTHAESYASAVSLLESGE